MALFNIFLENDDPNLGNELDNKLPGDWANEFVHRSKQETKSTELNERTNAETVKKAFIKEEVENFQTSVVLSKKILDIMMKHPDFYGIRIYLALDKNEKDTEKEPRNCFLIVPVDEQLKNITKSARKKSAKRAEETSTESGVSFYTEDPTCCPPRTGCDDLNSFS